MRGLGALWWSNPAALAGTPRRRLWRRRMTDDDDDELPCLVATLLHRLAASLLVWEVMWHWASVCMIHQPWLVRLRYVTEGN